MKILAVASEIVPLVKTGGLADVAGALPKSLKALGAETYTLIPRYRGIAQQQGRVKSEHALGSILGCEARLLHTVLDGDLDVLLLDAPPLYDRDGGPYADAAGVDWPDNPIRFAALAQAAQRIASGALAGWQPDIVHAHDWQAGLAPAYLKLAGGPSPKSVMTIHNLAFQGQSPPELLGLLGLPASSFAVEGLEYYGAIGYLKAGLYYADHITTVSPTYAREIQSPGAGMGMNGLLSTRAARGEVSGVLNGIDEKVWDPGSDPYLPAHYDAHDLSGKAKNKAALQEELGLEVNPERPLFCVVTRLTWQKGMDVLPEIIPALIARNAQLAVLGSGDASIQGRLGLLAAANPRAIACTFGYDEALSHRLQGGSDAILIPSRFEPCGLTQLYGLRYGTVPVVARVGGLADTIIDANDAALDAGVATGIQFAQIDAQGLIQAVDRLIALFHEPEIWGQIRRFGMERDFSWKRPAGLYVGLYNELLAQAE